MFYYVYRLIKPEKYFIENFTSSWPSSCHQWNFKNQERKKKILSGSASPRTLLLYMWELLWAQTGHGAGRKRGRNNREEGWVRMKDTAVRPSEPWESLLVFLMYGRSPGLRVRPGLWKPCKKCQEQVDEKVWQRAKDVKSQVCSLCQHYLLLRISTATPAA